MVAEWERLANVAVLTPTLAREVVATWAAWITADPARLPPEPARRTGDLQASLRSLMAQVRGGLDPEHEAAFLRK